MKHHHSLTQEEANLGLTTALAPCCHSCLYWQLPWPRRWWGALHRWLDKIFEGMGEGGGGGKKRERDRVSRQEYQSWKWKDIYKSCVTHMDYKNTLFIITSSGRLKKLPKKVTDERCWLVLWMDWLPQQMDTHIWFGSFFLFLLNTTWHRSSNPLRICISSCESFSVLGQMC